MSEQLPLDFHREIWHNGGNTSDTQSNDGEKYVGGEATEREGQWLQAFLRTHLRKFTPELAVECIFLV